ncbi:hypothetical protein C8R46DRAFT_1345154 [Mycena filopes]|nr:hypothetical protein C8R46DRAFT_1345154 [Mycena filopes]
MAGNGTAAPSTDPRGPQKPLQLSTIPREILETNEPVPDLILPSIRAFISEGSARRGRLDAKIASLRTALNELLEEREPLDIEVQKHLGAVSPLRRMPTELLSLIFAFASANDGLLSTHSGPWLVSMVCSRWRKVALAQPSLWTRINLDFTDVPPNSPELWGIGLTLVAQLKRSQGLPLNIEFCTFYPHSCTSRDFSLLEHLATHSQRWGTIKFSGPTQLYAFLDEHSIRDELPILRELDITVQPEDSDGILGPILVFESCPNLQRAFVNAGPYGGDRPVSVDLPFPQLLFYSGSNPWIHHVPALHSASNIVDCVLCLINMEPLLAIIPPGSPIVKLPQLLRLSVSTNTVLDFLEIPALQELYSYDRSRDARPALTRLPNLRKLFLGNCHLGAHVAPLLRASPTITKLCMYIPVASVGDLFSALAPQARSGSTQLASPLHTISLRVTRDGLDDDLDDLPTPHLDQDILLAALEAHWQCGGWRSVDLYCPQFTPTPVTLEWMCHLRSQGMDLQIFRRGSALLDHVIPHDLQLDTDSIYTFFEAS